ncbi:hypothetical protein BDV96DRAFT_646338 [Lophiotrema nucula]|uniref:Uncharacterized protein n=1 Tax=Lophiotrema nucula TaxID=690887 RepID=A0A6A5Z9A9_9PLEO|nr:hypothetical protein BDV96DRAFT_646338 [Lophiotrema nucula]
MTRPKARTISRPFDARHVAGVGVPGALPIGDLQRSSTTEFDNKENISGQKDGMEEKIAPKRSNTIAHSLSRPSLRLKTSMARLTNRSRSPSTSASSETTRRHRYEFEPDEDEQKRPTPLPILKRSTSSTFKRSTSSSSSAIRHAPSVTFKPTPPLPPSKSTPFPPTLPPREVPTKPPTRPKRADSGTAIDFTDVPADERPMGFKEILAVKSFEERMALYEKTRRYWASADHGLEDWIGRAAAGRSLFVNV